MKRLALVVLLFLAATLVAVAVDSELYVKTLYVERIYPHSDGYKIEYRLANSMFMAASYIPMEWFAGGPEARARMVYSRDRAVPFANVYWKNGEFDYVVLVVHPSFQHISWGVLQDSDAVRQRFAAGDPDFQF